MSEVRFLPLAAKFLKKLKDKKLKGLFQEAIAESGRIIPLAKQKTEISLAYTVTTFSITRRTMSWHTESSTWRTRLLW